MYRILSQQNTAATATTTAAAATTTTHYHTQFLFRWPIFLNLFLDESVSESKFLGNAVAELLWAECPSPKSDRNQNITISTHVTALTHPRNPWHYWLPRHKILQDETDTADIMISQCKLGHDVGTAGKVRISKLLVAAQSVLVQLQLQIDLCSKEILHPVIRKR